VEFAIGVPADQAGAPLELAIHDIAGRRVRTIVRRAAQAGRDVARWDLRDERGAPVPTGVYLARMTLGAYTLTRRVVALQ
jgi:flagellar hook assembly protein FlgD